VLMMPERRIENIGSMVPGAVNVIALDAFRNWFLNRYNAGINIILRRSENRAARETN
jgi:hypothetical protein